jgi:hypothetical protein
MNTISAMPEQQVKELLSKDYLGVIASRAGFKKNQPAIDNGVDLAFTYPTSYNKNGHKRILDSGHSLEFQLKATTENGIYPDANGFFYDLEVKNYNDLIYRRDHFHSPLILVVFILPADKNNWMNIDVNFLVMRKNAFWYYPAQHAKASSNASSVRIFVPDANRINAGFFNEMIIKFYS